MESDTTIDKKAWQTYLTWRIKALLAPRRSEEEDCHQTAEGQLCFVFVSSMKRNWPWSVKKCGLNFVGNSIILSYILPRTMGFQNAKEVEARQKSFFETVKRKKEHERMYVDLLLILIEMEYSSKRAWPFIFRFEDEVSNTKNSAQRSVWCILQMKPLI